MSRWTLVVLWTAGCGGLTPHSYSTDVADTDPANPDDDSELVEDSEVVEPEDTELWDTGAGADTEEEEEEDPPVTPPPVNWTPNGTYRGTFKMRMYVPILGNELCQGQVRVEVDLTQTPPINTTVQCSWPFFSLMIAGLGYNSVSGTFVGYINANNTARAVGSLEVTDGGDFADAADWVGTFSGDELTIEYDNVTPFIAEGIRGNFTLTR